MARITNPLVQFRHAHFLEFEADWRKLADVLEGSGGFKPGKKKAGYLIAHPREMVDHNVATPRTPTKKLLERQQLARYENFARSILKQTTTALFRERPSRIVGENKQDDTPTGIQKWWKNVEGTKGRKVSIDKALRRYWKAAATFGHCLIYMDRGEVTGNTAADQTPPILRVYSPLDVADWLEDDQSNLIGVKLIEQAPRTDFAVMPTVEQVRYRVVNEEGWILYDYQGKETEAGEHGMGCLPCVELFAERRLMYQHIGISLFGEPQLYIDHFNLISELRELFRKQAFSILNVTLGTGPDAPDLEKAKTLLDSQTGTEGVLFSHAPAQFISADATNMVAYMDHIQQLVRTIYRLAGVFFESDSKDAEAEGSLKLKREDMSQRLSGFADELQEADEALAQLWYRASYGDTWETKWDEDEVTIQYPDSFDMTPFDVVLEQAQAAMTLGFPPEVLKAIRKSLLVKFLPACGPKELEEYMAAIENQEDDVTPQEQQRAKLEAMARGDVNQEAA